MPAVGGAGAATRLCVRGRRRSRPRAHVSSRGRELGETTRADRKTRSARRCHSALARILESLAVALGTTDIRIALSGTRYWRASSWRRAGVTPCTPSNSVRASLIVSGEEAADSTMPYPPRWGLGAGRERTEKGRGGKEGDG